MVWKKAYKLSYLGDRKHVRNIKPEVDELVLQLMSDAGSKAFVTINKTKITKV